jgi:hypothetical protein
MRATRRNSVLLFVLLIAASVFTLGIDWGLPSRLDDRFLVGSGSALQLELLMSRLPEVDATRGADVVDSSGGPGAVLNDTDAQRARILVRYRLYSEQPDEMITFRSLSQMKPRAGDFDPRLYQYGGLWIYGTGAMIEAANLLGFAHITDRGNYIGNPRLFGKLYVVARFESAMWGVVAVWAVFVILSRLTNGRVLVAAIGAICFVAMPVVVNMAHEAKPHLAGAALVLLAVLAADNYVTGGKSRWAWITGIACGAAAGMVLWGVVALVLIPVMVTLRRQRWPGRLAAAVVAAIAVYGVTNPYVIYHLLHDPSVLRSNLGNTAAMYHVASPGGAVWNAFSLIHAGTGPVVWEVGILGTVLFLRRRAHRLAILMAAVSLAILVPFIASAAGKPGEYARFAIVPDAMLVIFAVAGLARMRSGSAAVILLAAITGVYGFYYVDGFMRDAWQPESTSRRVVAAQLQPILLTRMIHHPGQRPILGVYADPAPYCLPPVNLYDWEIVRLPRDYDAEYGARMADVVVRPSETVALWDWDPRHTPISWANKQFEVIERPSAWAMGR